MVTAFVNRTLTKLFGSRNERMIKAFRKRVVRINELEPEIRKLSDLEMKQRTAALKAKLTNIKPSTEKGAVATEEIDTLPEAFAIMREAMDRQIGLRSAFNPDVAFDVSKLPPDFQKMHAEIKARCVNQHDWRFVEIPVPLYDAIRAIVPEDRPPFRARPYDVQLIGGMVLFEGKIAEMATGEGKTFVAPLACFLMALTGKHTHVVTVNDYLVRRDANWVAPAFYALGMSVGFIQAFMDPTQRQRAYQCDVTYGTNSEFGFDYLRDNMKMTVAEQVQGPLDFAIVDEVDSILIDEARTPLIISGPAEDNSPKYKAADEVARKLILAHKPWEQATDAVDQAKRKMKGAEGDIRNQKGDTKKVESLQRLIEEGKKELEAAEARLASAVQMYEVEYDRKSVHLTHEGIQKAQEYAGVGSFYIGKNMDWPHLLEQSLRAHVVYENDREYVVEKNPQNGDMEVIIVDEFTGRKMVGRQWSDGLHQAVEAKERVTVKAETQTMATITLQNFFKLYKRLGGMTGTAMTEAEEFMKIYTLDVVQVPTNRAPQRTDQQDLIFMSEKAKWNAIVEQIKEIHERGQPVLVGTTSVEKSQRLSDMLMRRHGIEHNVLNAKNHEREAQIVAEAGTQYTNKLGKTVGRVTIATNMAGRGTDIKLADTVSPVGGLFVLGTERHEARRIDNQLRGRSGRQGDPGESRFFLSLDDDLMKLFAGDFVMKALRTLGMKDDEAIEHGMVSRSVQRAQKKVEERNFGIRKNLLEYDEVRDVQRSYFYGKRQTILEGRNLQEIIFDLIGEAVDDAVATYLDRDYAPSVISGWVKENFNTVIDPSELREHDLGALENTIKDKARDTARDSINTSISEFLDPDADPQDWDYAELSSWASTYYAVTLPISELRKMDREEITETLVTQALQQIDSKDVAAVQKFLEPNYAQQQLAEWAYNKFDLRLSASELVGKDITAAADFILNRASAAYKRREIEYPIEYAMEVTAGSGGPQNIYVSEQLAQWVAAKYGVPISSSEIRDLTEAALHQRLITISETSNGEIDKQVDEAIERYTDSTQLAEWVSKRFVTPVEGNEFDGEPVEEKRERLHELGHAFLRRELTEMERTILLQIFDTTWKDHLYAMDQLRESIGLRGFAEKDPRIEYKKEGAVLFREFQKSIRDKVTDVIFKVRLSRAQQVKNVYANQHEEFAKSQSYGVGASPAAQQARMEQQAAAPAEERRAEQEEVRVQQIVNDTAKVGRNDPCPCGSGKKYKQCCGKAA